MVGLLGSCTHAMLSQGNYFAKYDCFYALEASSDKVSQTRLLFLAEAKTQEAMSLVACVDSQNSICVCLHYTRKAQENVLRKTLRYPKVFHPSC